MKKIVLTGGGTAGHCTPHFALIDGLKKSFDKIYYIGSENGIEKSLVKERGIEYYPIPTVKLKRKLTTENLLLPFKLIKSVSVAKKRLNELKPDVIFSKGGFVGLPVTLAAKKLKIPVIIHESDYTMGLANKLASRFSELVLLSFDKEADKVKNSLVVGTPIRKELFERTKDEGLKKYGLSLDKPVLLITGGSSGAKALNELVLDSLDELLKWFQVLHLVGKGNLTGIKKQGYVELEFTDMSYAYAATTIALSRAGANTAFELIALKKPTLFIPLPLAESRGDQIQNAKYFHSKGVADYREQASLNKSSLVDAILNLFTNKDYYIKNIKKLKLNLANDKINEILSKY